MQVGDGRLNDQRALSLFCVWWFLKVLRFSGLLKTALTNHPSVFAKTLYLMTKNCGYDLSLEFYLLRGKKQNNNIEKNGRKKSSTTTS